MPLSELLLRLGIAILLFNVALNLTRLLLQHLDEWMRSRHVLEQVSKTVEDRLMTPIQEDLVVLRMDLSWLGRMLHVLPREKIQDEYGFKLTAIGTCTKNGIQLLYRVYSVLVSPRFISDLETDGISKEEADDMSSTSFATLVDKFYDAVVEVNPILQRRWIREEGDRGKKQIFPRPE